MFRPSFLRQVTFNNGGTVGMVGASHLQKNGVEMILTEHSCRTYLVRNYFKTKHSTNLDNF
jgi:hypothetical protein